MPATRHAPSSAAVHPTATIHPSSVIGEDAVIEAEAYVGPDCVIGDGTRLRVRSMILERTTLGAGCDVHPYAVLGGDPQDRKFDPANPGSLVIGDRNIFREGVTIHRSVGDERPTTIGSDCFFMANSHAGHNTIVGDGVTLANGTLLAGHVILGDRCVFGGNSGVHQHCDVGEGAMIQGGAILTMHVVPFSIVSLNNQVVGVNVIGLRRGANASREDIAEIKQVYKALFRDRRPWSASLESLKQRSWGEPARRMIDFVERVRAYDPPRARGVIGGVR